MASRPCLRCGTPTPNRFCDACLPETHRYRSWRWDQLSRRLRRLYGCVVCGTKVDTQVHHRIPLAEGGSEYELSNLEVRCTLHHAEAHRPAQGRW